MSEKLINKSKPNSAIGGLTILTKPWKGSKQEAIYELICRSKEASIPEITETLKVNNNTVRSSVRNLRDKGLIQHIGRGKYKLR